MGTITLIRHGQASFGKANYDQLSDLGMAQARLVGRHFNGLEERLDRTVMGSMQRHRQTAEGCLESLDEALQPAQPPDTDAGFNEYDHQQMLLTYEPRFAEPEFLRQLFQGEKHPQRAFQTLFSHAFARWISGRHDAEYSESWADFRDRCLAALERVLTDAGRGEHIAIFTSGGPITAITQKLLQLPDQQVADLNSSIANASVTRLLYQPGKISLTTLNYYGHLVQFGGRDKVSFR